MRSSLQEFWAEARRSEALERLETRRQASLLAEEADEEVHVQAVLILMQSANSVSELRRLVRRRYGCDQLNLFDGWESIAAS